MFAPWSDRGLWLERVKSRVPSATVVLDLKHELWDTAKRAWLECASDASATHAMVLSDDMIPSVDFERTLERLVGEKPNAVISVFSFPGVLWAQEIAYGKDRKPGWRSCGPCFWGGTVIVPRALVPDMIEKCDRMRDLIPGGPPDCQVDDVRIAKWAEDLGVECAHWYPQLLEHVGAACSLIGMPDAAFRRGLPEQALDVAGSVR
jgi:hypothetical protein